MLARHHAPTAVLSVVPTLALALALLAARSPAWSAPTRELHRSVPADEPPAQATIAPGHIVVTGRLFHTDRVGDRNHPATGMRVEIWDKDERFPASGEKLAETVTDRAGRFASPPISNVDYDGPANQVEGTQDVFLKLFTDGGAVRLLETGRDRPFEWTSYEINPRNGGPLRNVPDGLVAFPTQYIVESTKNVEAVWTFVDLAEAWHMLRAASGREPGPVTAYWSGGSLRGPLYDPEARVLHFRDEDAGYASVILQHAAYAFLHDLYGSLPPSWRACLDDVPVDPRRPVDAPCALFHGFAVFLATAVPGHPVFETPALPAVDIDLAAAGSPGWSDGDAVPGRVAGAFWDLHDGDRTVETYDSFDATFADIWEVFDARRPETMRDWWEGWLDLGKDGCGAVGSLFQNTIDYNTGPQISPIPDVVIDEDESAIVDLNNYVHDAECGPDGMAFTMIDAGAPEAGVVLLPTNVVSITPDADWFGQTRVRIAVSDGLATGEAAFQVIVRSVNDCPRISPRVPDPPPALYFDPIVLELEGHGRDVEDAPGELVWDVEMDPRHASDLTVLGRGSTTLTFLLVPRHSGGYSVIVTLVVRDTSGCEARQPVALYWTDRANNPPLIRWERFTQEYRAPVNTTIRVDLTGVATDPEDGEQPLEWFVLNGEQLDAQVRREGRQVLDFEPRVGYVGSNVAQLEVQDTGAARTTAAITLTWSSRNDVANQPPRILRNLLLGKTVGINATACYELTHMAVDPDHNQMSLRWYAQPDDPRDLFVGAQATRRICLQSRPDYEGCQVATFVVRDPRDAHDSHPVRTCWRAVHLHVPFASR